MRRPLQIGPSRFDLEQGPGGWFVHETWDTMGWERTRDSWEDFFGPYTREGAEAAMSELVADRGRKVA